MTNKTRAEHAEAEFKEAGLLAATGEGFHSSKSALTGMPLGTAGAPNGFYEYLPPGYGDGLSRPLLVFWHGLGENGNGTTDLPRVLVHGPPKLIAENRWSADRPFVVLSPQHDGKGTCPTADEIHAFITWSLGKYAVDPARVYLTGVSCGAIGAWDYLGKYRGVVVAAAVLISGDGRKAWASARCALGEVAIWGFHGEVDERVSADGTRIPMEGLIGCTSPRKDARLTIYPGVKHNAWSQTYDLSAGHDIFEWMLRNPKM